MEAGLEHIRHVPFDSAAAAAAATILLELEKQDKPIGPLDMLIAGTVVSRGAALATSNAGEFSRVPGLRVVDWTARTLRQASPRHGKNPCRSTEFTP